MFFSKCNEYYLPIYTSKKKNSSFHRPIITFKITTPIQYIYLILRLFSVYFFFTIAQKLLRIWKKNCKLFDLAIYTVLLANENLVFIKISICNNISIIQLIDYKLHLYMQL